MLTQFHATEFDHKIDLLAVEETLKLSMKQQVHEFMA